MKVSSLTVYPIKSAAGTAVDAFEVGGLGPVDDRRYMVVDPEGQMVTQRQAHRLALVRPTLNAAGLSLDAPGQDRLEVVRPDLVAPRTQVRVWSDTCEAALTDDAVGAWLSAFLGREVRLVFMPDDVVRPVDRRYAGPDARVSFADGFSVLLATEASLSDLNGRLAEPVGMDRFRPNLVVAGAEPWAEDGWSRVTAGEVTFDVVKPCSRCVMTTIDQATGRAGEEPMKTLAGFRRRDGKVLFGQNLVHCGRGRVAVGDPVVVESRG